MAGDIVSALKETPVPTLLIVGGLCFLFLAIVGQLGGHFRVPAHRQKWAGLIGGLLLLTGISLHVIRAPAKEPAPPAIPPTATVEEIPTSTAPPPTATSSPTLAPGTRQYRRVDGMAMVYVSGGTFQMGSEKNDPDAEEDEFPQRRVRLDSFWIDQNEVTNSQFAEFLNEKGNQIEDEKNWLNRIHEDCLIERMWGRYQPRNGYADHPVILVSWYGARAYCKWVGGRLPTEAEWEYAARGKDGHTHPWGDDLDCTRCNFDDSSISCSDEYTRTAPVRQFPSGNSWCEAMDMAGNVWEWVDDWYSVDYYGCRTTPSENPTGPSYGEYRVQRGGSWNSEPRYVRSADRARLHPYDTYSHGGFRCAMDFE